MAQNNIAQKNEQKKLKKQQIKKDIAEQIQEETKETLLPSIKTKMEEVSNYILEKVYTKKEEINVNQIMSLIAERSIADIAVVRHKTYTPEELCEAFNIYVKMINKINEYIKFPPTKSSFCTLLGISTTTYDNWKAMSDKTELLEQIDTYMLSSINTNLLTNDVNTIGGIYIAKTMGQVEKQAPTVIKYERNITVDEIKNKLTSMNVIEADYEEVEKDVSSSD